MKKFDRAYEQVDRCVRGLAELVGLEPFGSR
jgi:hypothetical protein